MARSGLNSLPGVRLSPPEGELPSASALDNARLNALVVVPNALQGIFRRRRRAVAAATRADVDRWGAGLLAGMRRAHGGSPVWIRIGPSRALLLLSVADVQAALEGSPDPFAADPEAKRKGMVCFQPDALTISRNPEWRERREFAEAVLDTRAAAHRHAGRFAALIAEEADDLVRAVDSAGGVLGWEEWALAVRRITRRVVLGDGARDDEALTDLLAAMMDEANSMPGEPSTRLGEFRSRLAAHIDRAEAGSLASIVGDAPRAASVEPAAQFTHFLFAMGDTLAANSLRALFAVACHPAERTRAAADVDALGELGGEEILSLAHLAGCLQEAMRLWPTTPMLSRELTGDARLGGREVPAGTQVVIVNTFMHRDRDTHPGADRFEPEAWIDGPAPQDWAFNHLSHGPQGCPGADLAIFAGTGLIANVTRLRGVTPESGAIDPARPMPHMLDHFSLRLRLSSPA